MRSGRDSPPAVGPPRARVQRVPVAAHEVPDLLGRGPHRHEPAGHAARDPRNDGLQHRPPGHDLERQVVGSWPCVRHGPRPRSRRGRGPPSTWGGQAPGSDLGPQATGHPGLPPPRPTATLQAARVPAVGVRLRGQPAPPDATPPDARRLGNRACKSPPLLCTAHAGRPRIATRSGSAKSTGASRTSGSARGARPAWTGTAPPRARRSRCPRPSRCPSANLSAWPRP
jgi:hypothetical protein